MINQSEMDQFVSEQIKSHTDGAGSESLYGRINLNNLWCNASFTVLAFLKSYVVERDWTLSQLN